MNDLISRKAAIEEFEEMVTSVSVYGESAEARYATNARLRFIDKLNEIPSVPAVPLDKLCEWLSDSAYMYLTEKELDAGYSSHDPVYWEMKLKDWMEAQDA